VTGGRACAAAIWCAVACSAAACASIPEPAPRLEAEAASGIRVPAVIAPDSPAGPAVALAESVPAVADAVLLLPQSGPYAGLSTAFVDGFFASRFAAPAPRLDVRIHDTGGGEEALRAAYDDALRQDPEVIVGPLLKPNVDVLAREGPPPVPILALNYISEGAATPQGFYEVGLAPDDEARAAAASAIAHGLVSAVVLAADDGWGDRVLEAFRAHFEALGGSIAASATFAADGSDYAGPIRDVLAITASRERSRALAATLGARPHFEVRRRQDVDVVFVAARPADARMILPQLRFYRAEDLPVYATAAAYDGRIAARTREGLMFCDVPLLLEKDAPTLAGRTALELLVHQDLDESRMFALGYDAYVLAAELAVGPLVAGSQYAGMAGRFSVETDGTLGRELACARIAGGSLEPIDGVGPR
jgi:outer membrane PBP1 activator LpoA protein